MSDTIFCHNCWKLKSECKCGLKPENKRTLEEVEKEEKKDFKEYS